ncbi:TRAP transporter small permease [Enterovirga sp. CN4-39]|uniref:TRAP transporter small permease n=1 Tax=Enterovirga sp. CN4-39 TaxID=3400910 RepID=UPI003C097882
MMQAQTPREAGPVRRLLDGLYLLAGWLAGLFLIAILLLMMGLSLGREVGFNIPAGDDFASWCMAAMAFLGLAHTFKHGDMIRVGLLIDRLKGRTRWFFEMFSLLIGTGFVGYFAWYAAVMTWQSWEFSDTSTGVVAVPLWIPQLGFSGGLAILLVAFVDELVHVAAGGMPRYEKPPPQSADEVIERAMESAV